MGSRWFNVAVVLLWVGTMTWLTTQKILPAMLVGDPPSNESMLEAQLDAPLTAWEVRCNEQRVGTAVTRVEVAADSGMKKVDSRVHFDRFPGGELLEPLLGRTAVTAEGWGANLPVDLRTQLTFDPFSRLSQFDTTVEATGLLRLRVSGRVNGATIELESNLPGIPKQLPVPREVVLGDPLSPQATMRQLRLGQTWTLQTYNVLHRLYGNPEVLQARVEKRERFDWNGATHWAWVVVYRRDPGSAVGDAEAPVGKLLVLEDGTIVRQEARVLEQRISLCRIPDDEARKWARVLELPDSPAGAGRRAAGP